jgi:hypothetical protein
MTAKPKLLFMAVTCLMALALGLTGYAFAVDGTDDSSGAQYGPAPTDPPPTTDPIPPDDTGDSTTPPGDTGDDSGDSTTPPGDTGDSSGDQYGPPPADTGDGSDDSDDSGDESDDSDDSDDGTALPPADNDSEEENDEVTYRNHGERVSNVARDRDAHSSHDLPNGHVSDNHGHAVSQAAHDHSGEDGDGQGELHQSRHQNRHGR